MAVDYSIFEASLRNLLAQEENRRSLAEDYPALIRDAVTESVVQRFEVCYDALWKALHRHLIDVTGAPDVLNGPRPTFRAAGRAGLLPGDPARWEDYVDARIATTHGYGAPKVEQALGVLPDFLADAAELYSRMTGEPWA